MSSEADNNDELHVDLVTSHNGIAEETSPTINAPEIKKASSGP